MSAPTKSLDGHAAVMFRAGFVSKIDRIALYSEAAARDLEQCSAEDAEEITKKVEGYASELEEAAALLRRWIR